MVCNSKIAVNELGYRHCNSYLMFALNDNIIHTTLRSQSWTTQRGNIISLSQPFAYLGKKVQRKKYYYEI